MKKIIKNLMIIIAICMTNTSFAAQNLPPVKLEVYYGGTLCPENKIVYINAAPQLLDLKTKLMWEKDSQATKNASVSWKAEIVFNRSPRNDKKSFSAKKKGNEEWNVWNTKTSDLFGGKVTITAIIEGKSLKRILHIRGKNPGEETIKNLIGASPWYAIPIAKHESDKPSQLRYLCQFNNPDKFGQATANDLMRECPNANSKADGGFGIFQITNPAPTIDELWNWRANVKEGKIRINKAIRHANLWMNSPIPVAEAKNCGQRIQARSWNNGNDVPIPNKAYYNVIFSDVNAKNQRTFEDAVAIKIFNSAKNQFVFWSASNTWDFNEINGQGKYYVKEVCKEVE